MIAPSRTLQLSCSSRLAGIRAGLFCWVLLFALSLFLLAGSGVEAAQKAPKASKHAKSHRKASVLTFRPGLEPKAVELLKAAGERIAAARSMTFTAVVSYESPSRFGHPLVYTVKSEVALQRPDKFRVITPGDGPAQEFYYDGKTMTAFEPAANLVAVTEAPPTIDAMLKKAYDQAAIYFPFTDLIVTDPYRAMINNGLKHAFYIGQSQEVGGTKTDMVAIVDDWVFEQIWIGAEDKLPRRARAVFLADPAMLRHDVELSNWQIDPVIPADAFASSKAAGATHIKFDRPDAKKVAPVDKRAKRKRSTAK
jgi:hypothetical protein